MGSVVSSELDADCVPGQSARALQLTVQVVAPPESVSGVLAAVLVYFLFAHGLWEEGH